MAGRGVAYHAPAPRSEDLGLECPSVHPRAFSFLGPNGAGKSTTMSMLCILLGATLGHARVPRVLTEQGKVRD
jgi:ABC-2 type transport system ATP-binding protein